MSHKPNPNRVRGLGPASSNRRRQVPDGPSLTSVAMGAFAVALAGLALILALVQALSSDLPKLEQLETYRPRLITRVYGIDDTTVIKEFYTERRVQVPLDSISPYLIEAILATEDQRYYKHWGVDPLGIARAIFVNLATMSRAEGASTLTQQLARHLYLHLRKTWTRKIREMITAVQIERTYAKDEILQMYFTQMYFGHGTYGVQSAASFYFGADARTLTLPQSAMLVALLKSPNYYSPRRNPAEALRRRNTVLARMLAVDFISRQDYLRAKGTPLMVSARGEDELGTAPYFTEWVRQDLERLEDELGFDYYRDGLIVHTTLDPELQQIAEMAVDSHMTSFQQQFDSRFTKGGGLEDWLTANYQDSLRSQGLLAKRDTVEVEVPHEEFVGALRRLGAATLIDSTLRDSLASRRELSVRDLARFVVADSAVVDSILDKHFNVQVAFVAMNPDNGDVWAMIGGRDFRRSKFNRAVQANRQPGSVFKPFVYTTAIDNGIYANYRILNMVQPLRMGDGTWWRPENYNTNNRGEEVTLREGLRRSLNNVTVRMVAGEDRIVPLREVIKYAHRMGISSRLQPVPALALGSNGVIPIDMVTAYGVFASGGARSTPRSITRIQDRNGQELAYFGVKREQVLSEETAAIMRDMLADVVDRGTGGSSRWRWGFRAPAAGKTGTTNNYNNAWFLGFSPKIVAGVWVGFDDPKKSLGYGMSGASAALPIWAIFMKYAYQAKDWPNVDFSLPVGVVEVPICSETGMAASPYCPQVYDELFRRSDEPSEPCSLHGVRASSGSTGPGGW